MDTLPRDNTTTAAQCKSLAPEYEQLGAAFSTTPDVHIVQIDADKHKKLGKRFKVEGFPTLKWVQKGSSFEEAEDVNAERTADALLEYVNGKTGQTKRLKGAAPSSVTDITPESFSKISESGAHAFIGFFAPWYVAVLPPCLLSSGATVCSESTNSFSQIAVLVR